MIYSWLLFQLPLIVVFFKAKYINNMKLLMLILGSCKWITQMKEVHIKKNKSPDDDAFKSLYNLLHTKI